MSVDLPAPFSPTSACTSARCTSRSTPSSARTPGNVLTIPCMRSSGDSILLACVSLRVLPDSYVDALVGRLSLEGVVNSVDRHLADLIRMLNGIAIHLTVFDCGARFRRRVVADDDDFAGETRGLDRRYGAERRIVVDAEDALEIL